jgi:hypothetical protein
MTAEEMHILLELFKLLSIVQKLSPRMYFLKFHAHFWLFPWTDLKAFARFWILPTAPSRTHL